jgi:hypothetical protein
MVGAARLREDCEAADDRRSQDRVNMPGPGGLALGVKPLRSSEAYARKPRGSGTGQLVLVEKSRWR